ncbi:DUF418 domain-containing protein [Paenibacillus pinisoli]|uniref:DUF418 domain-containing protein n=1 Tax=Paenibacillus pinisoli TaxID=1276110 RepID=A0A3A6PQT4_9BACL|nr:DUF418 domain-containing protein [Paenibacillus pinisoli]RJX39001.1 DUF418 domain-containing protein [Paenibacillus pinisoli]
MNQLKTRITALDYTRAWAIFGMIIVNYKLAMQAGNGGSELLQKIAGLLEGRASALFVLLAGIGVSLMTTKARMAKNEEQIRRNRYSLYKRAAFLLAAGMALLLLDWNADILHYYAVFLVAASLLITAPDKRLLGLFIFVLVTAQLLLVLFDYTKGWDAGFQSYAGFWTAEGFTRNLMFNGFHPFFPWFGFFLIGMWIGRKGWLSPQHRLKVLLYSLSGAVVIESLSYFLIKLISPVLGNEAAIFLFGTKPMPPTMLYVLSGICTAVAFLALCLYTVEKFDQSILTQAMIHTGQLSLSHYVGHIVLGLGLLEFAGYLENGSLEFAMAYGSLYFAAAIVFSHWWRKRMARGPIEWAMRKLG